MTLPLSEYTSIDDSHLFGQLRVVGATEEEPRDAIGAASKILGYDVMEIARTTPGSPTAAADLDEVLGSILGYPLLELAPDRLERLRTAASERVETLSTDEDDAEELAERAELTKALLDAELETLPNDDPA